MLKNSLPKTKRSKRDENREKSKEIILRASLELFALKGYGSTTLEMIADRAGVSRGLPYLYFESKEELLNAILERHFQREGELIKHLPKKTLCYESFVNTIVERMAAPFKNGHNSNECLEMRLIMSMLLLPDTKLIIYEKIKKFHSEIMKEYFDELKSMFKQLGVEDAEVEMEYLRTVFFGFSFLVLCLGNEFDSTAIQKKMFCNYLNQLKCCADKKKPIV